MQKKTPLVCLTTAEDADAFDEADRAITTHIPLNILCLGQLADKECEVFNFAVPKTRDLRGEFKFLENRTFEVAIRPYKFYERLGRQPGSCLLLGLAPKPRPCLSLASEFSVRRHCPFWVLKDVDWSRFGRLTCINAGRKFS